MSNSKEVQDTIREVLGIIKTLTEENEQESHKFEECADIHIGRAEAFSDLSQKIKEKWKV